MTYDQPITEENEMRNPLSQNDTLIAPTTFLTVHDLVMTSLTYLSAKDLLGLRMVSRKFNEAVADIIRQAMQSIPNALLSPSIQRGVIELAENISSELAVRETTYTNLTSYRGHCIQNLPINMALSTVGILGDILFLQRNNASRILLVLSPLMLCAAVIMVAAAMTALTFAWNKYCPNTELCQQKDAIKALKRTAQFFSANNETTQDDSEETRNIDISDEIREPTADAASPLDGTPLLQP